ncbi:MAG TPA: sigma-70 family RNA polymerase sigma factor [Verrucomicrobiae bacterium]|jgi:RNA polymerase sigma-70 factor, ECF subfamily|nr:sigma-70 family RNA polymerase sigma factor [Verrucomicrobiae bacterium]
MNANSAQFAVKEAACDDLDLVHASKTGDVTAFEQLVKRYDRKLLRIAQSVTHNREDSQDVVQEAFLKAYQNLSAFREDSKFSTWLIRITVNQSLMKLRKQRTTKEESLNEDFQAEGDIGPIEVTDWAPNPEQLYWASELRTILINCLEELSPILRTVFVLRDIEGLTIDQTVEVLNVSETAVKARLWRARLQLREGLTKYFSRQTQATRKQLFPSRRQTGRILGLFAECLRDSISRPDSINVAESDMHAATFTASADKAECSLTNV